MKLNITTVILGILISNAAAWCAQAESTIYSPGKYKIEITNPIQVPKSFFQPNTQTYIDSSTAGIGVTVGISFQDGIMISEDDANQLVSAEKTNEQKSSPIITLKFVARAKAGENFYTILQQEVTKPGAPDAFDSFDINGTINQDNWSFSEWVYLFSNHEGETGEVTGMKLDRVLGKNSSSFDVTVQEISAAFPDGTVQIIPVLESN